MSKEWKDEWMNTFEFLNYNVTYLKNILEICNFYGACAHLDSIILSRNLKRTVRNLIVIILFSPLSWLYVKVFTVISLNEYFLGKNSMELF